MYNWYGTEYSSVMTQNNFQTSFRAIDEKPPMVWIVGFQSYFIQQTLNITPVYTIMMNSKKQ